MNRCLCLLTAGQVELVVKVPGVSTSMALSQRAVSARGRHRTVVSTLEGAFDIDTYRNCVFLSKYNDAISPLIIETL